MSLFLIAGPIDFFYAIGMKLKSGKGDKGQDERLARVTEYIRASLNETPDYNQLARLADLSYCQLFRLFKCHLGISPQRYIERQRISYAKKLLALPHLSIKEIAVQVGFLNQLYFSRRFQKATGLSPSQYRQNLWNDPEKALHPYSYDMGLFITPHTYGSFA